MYYTECKLKKQGRPGNKNRSQILLPHSEVDNITMGVHIHIPVWGEPSARWAGLVPLLSSPLIGSQLVAGGLERVLQVEVGVVLPLVLTTSYRGRRREEEGEKINRKGEKRSRMEEKSSECTIHISLGTNAQQID